jgi:hypothetical protein
MMDEVIAEEVVESESTERIDFLQRFLDVIKESRLSDVFGTVDIAKIAEMDIGEVRYRLEESIYVGDQLKDEDGKLYVCVYNGDDDTCVFVGEDTVFSEHQFTTKLKKTGKTFEINKEGWFVE